MRSTAQYRLFTAEPGARRLARARALMHEGRPEESELAYRTALTEDPDDRTAWTELFELFRSRGRWEDALSTAEHAADCQQAASWLMTELRRLGCPTVELLEGRGHPTIWAESPKVPGAPTVLIYGHYDVQPVE
ncbi:MAG TPA: tetratricopeptide repeat protein, partial [Gemmatimonadales bacterium]|nr:tetratricopeptide repeat protein [Gemmatimonadales bacterium]